MYQSYYHLSCKPFPSTPSPKTVFMTPEFQNALSTLSGFVNKGEGIALVTSGPGLGKTLLLQILAQKFRDDHVVISLPSAGFSTRADLLQAMLFGFGQPYTGLKEQELRLKLISALRSYEQSNQGCVVFIDEAHLLSERLLDELRGLMNFLAGDRPLFSLILAGSTKLEEKLTDPHLDAFNQRLCEHVSLEPLTRQEAINYLSFRLLRHGSSLSSCFQDQAVELMIHAADGSPRALNQLADAALTLGFQLQRKPVPPQLIISALEELQRLPQTWQIPQMIVKTEAVAPANVVEDHAPQTWFEETLFEEAGFEKKGSHEANVYEFGGEDESEGELETVDLNDETGVDDERLIEVNEPIAQEVFQWEEPSIIEAGIEESEAVVEEVLTSQEVAEKAINDHYAILDYRRHLLLTMPIESPDMLATPSTTQAELEQIIDRLDEQGLQDIGLLKTGLSLHAHGDDQENSVEHLEETEQLCEAIAELAQEASLFLQTHGNGPAQGQCVDSIIYDVVMPDDEKIA